MVASGSIEGNSVGSDYLVERTPRGIVLEAIRDATGIAANSARGGVHLCELDDTSVSDINQTRRVETKIRTFYCGTREDMEACQLTTDT